MCRDAYPAWVIATVALPAVGWVVTSFAYHWGTEYRRPRVRLCVCSVRVSVREGETEALLVLHLLRIKRTPRGVVGVVHQRGTRAHLQISIIPPRVPDENSCLCVCV